MPFIVLQSVYGIKLIVRILTFSSNVLWFHDGKNPVRTNLVRTNLVRTIAVRTIFVRIFFFVKQLLLEQMSIDLL